MCCHFIAPRLFYLFIETEKIFLNTISELSKSISFVCRLYYLKYKMKFQVFFQYWSIKDQISAMSFLFSSAVSVIIFYLRLFYQMISIYKVIRSVPRKFDSPYSHFTSPGFHFSIIVVNSCFRERQRELIFKSLRV